MVADYPSAYRGHPALAMLAKIPSTWDDTKVLSGDVGEHIVIARRSGPDWYVGDMNDRKRRSLPVPLRFLGPGRFRAEIHADDLQGKTPRRLARRTDEVTSADVLRVGLEAAGGFMVRLSPLPEKSSKSGK